MFNTVSVTGWCPKCPAVVSRPETPPEPSHDSHAVSSFSCTRCSCPPARPVCILPRVPRDDAETKVVTDGKGIRKLRVVLLFPETGDAAQAVWPGEQPRA